MLCHVHDLHIVLALTCIGQQLDKFRSKGVKENEDIVTRNGDGDFHLKVQLSMVKGTRPVSPPAEDVGT